MRLTVLSIFGRLLQPLEGETLLQNLCPKIIYFVTREPRLLMLRL